MLCLLTLNAPRTLWEFSVAGRKSVIGQRLVWHGMDRRGSRRHHRVALPRDRQPMEVLCCWSCYRAGVGLTPPGSCNSAQPLMRAGTLSAAAAASRAGSTSAGGCGHHHLGQVLLERAVARARIAPLQARHGLAGQRRVDEQQVGDAGLGLVIGPDVAAGLGGPE